MLYQTPAAQWAFSVVEAGLCFLEIRPYHFNSGYIRSYLLRHIKKAPLTEKQGIRLVSILACQKAWRKSKIDNKKFDSTK